MQRYRMADNLAVRFEHLVTIGRALVLLVVKFASLVSAVTIMPEIGLNRSSHAS